MTHKRTAARARSLSVISSGLLLTAALAEPVVPPARPLELRYVAGSAKPSASGNWQLRFTARNPNPTAVSYSGYPVDATTGAPPSTITPRYRLELQRKQSWSSYSIGWCGTGKQALLIRAGQTVAFQVHVPPGDWDAIRTGLTWSEGNEFTGTYHTDWSQPVTHGELPPPPPSGS